MAEMTDFTDIEKVLARKLLLMHSKLDAPTNVLVNTSDTAVLDSLYCIGSSKLMVSKAL